MVASAAFEKSPTPAKGRFHGGFTRLGDVGRVRKTPRCPVMWLEIARAKGLGQADKMGGILNACPKALNLAATIPCVPFSFMRG